jgi:enoyl-CoA hydratase
VPTLSLQTPSDGVALVTLERPAKRNALSIDLRYELAEAFENLGADPAVACAVLTGQGSAFCAGMDVTQFGGDDEHRRLLVDSSRRSFGAVRSCPKPVIAAVNGPAVAGGFALALLCDLRIAAPSAVFGFAELPRGIPPAYGAARAALPGALAKELALTGRVLDAEEAERLGVAAEVVADPVARSLELASQIASQPAAALATKRRILIEREHLFGPLFAEEERAFHAALLGRTSVQD